MLGMALRREEGYCASPVQWNEVPPPFLCPNLLKGVVTNWDDLADVFLFGVSLTCQVLHHVFDKELRIATEEVESMWIYVSVPTPHDRAAFKPNG